MRKERSEGILSVRRSMPSPVATLGVALLLDIERLLLDMWHLLDTGARKAVALPAKMTATSRE